MTSISTRVDSIVQLISEDHFNNVYFYPPPPPTALVSTHRILYPSSYIHGHTDILQSSDGVIKNYHT